MPRCGWSARHPPVARRSGPEGESERGRRRALEPDELERLVSAAYLGGRRDEGYEKWDAAHNAYTARGDVARAARCAFWIAFGLLNSGELARGGGWVDRAQRLLDEAGLDCVEHGHLRYAGGLKAIFSGDGETAHAGFTTAVHIGDRFGDIEISTPGAYRRRPLPHLHGRSRCRRGTARRGDGVGRCRGGVAHRGGRCLLHGDRRVLTRCSMCAAPMSGPPR